MKGRTKIIIAAVIGAIVSVTLPIGGRTIIGFRYRAVDDNANTVCPDWVVGQSGNVITLSMGEKFRVRDMTPADLTAMLLRSNALVKVDHVRNYLFVRTRCFSCGMRPEGDQWITIPVWESERTHTYCAEGAALLEPVAAAAAGPK